MLPDRKEFDAYDWQQLIAKCDQKDCFHYCSLFCKKSAEAQESGDSKTQSVFSTLAAVTCAALKSDSTKEPFHSDWIERFTAEHLSFFKDLAPSVVDAEMRARLADVVWTRQLDPEMGKLAVDSYLKSAKILEDPEHWSSGADRVVRAVNIGRLLGRNSEQFSCAIAYVQSILAKYNGDDPSLLSAEMMELLQEYRKGQDKNYAALANKAAERALANKQWHIARRYLQIQAEWHFLANEPETAYLVRQEIAETYVKEAEEIINRPKQAAPHSHACHKIERAIKAYKDLGGPDARTRWEELYRLLREYQQKANTELLPINTPFDSTLTALATACTEFAVNQIKGRPFSEALQRLADLPLVQSVSQLREQVDNHVRKSPVSTILPTVIHGSSGQVVARPPVRPTTKEEQIEAEVRTNLFWYSNLERQFRTQFMLLPAIKLLNAEHRVRLKDIISFVIDNPFVPAGREFLYAKGLHAGITGDYLVATHLLIPQIENSIRYVLSQNGIITSGFTNQGIQNHYDLNKMFNDQRIEQKLTDILGADLFFDLKSLLVHHAGANLRNEIVHGTLGVNEFNSDFHGLQSVYLWWISLRLCFTRVLRKSETTETEDAT